MALIKCPECGKEFSDKAQACPNCGCPTLEIKKQEIKPEEAQENEPEFELQLENNYSVKIVSDIMKLFYQNGFILESDVRGFVINWFSEDEELGRKQLKVVFSHPGYKKPLKLSVSSTSERYEKAKYFVENVADKYFKKDICPSYFEAGQYAEKHVDNVLFRKAYENEKEVVKASDNIGQNKINKNLCEETSEIYKYKITFGDIVMMSTFLAISILFAFLINGLWMWTKILYCAIFFFSYFVMKTSYNQVGRLKESKMKCEKCGCDDIDLSFVKTGSIVHMYGTKSGNSMHGNTQDSIAKVAICKQCGYSWNYIRNEDIQIKKSRNKLWMNYWMISLIIVIVILFVF